MLVRLMTNQINYNNYQPQKVHNNTSFKGKLGVKVLKEITSSGAKDSAGIAGVLKKMGLGFLGLISVSKLNDILEPFVSRFNNFEEEMKNKENGLRAQELIFEADKKAFQEEMESQKQAFENENKSIREELNNQMKKLAEKEKALNNVEHILRQGEIDELKSSIMTAYGIKAPDAQIFDSAGEQILQVIDTINKNKKTAGRNGVFVENMNEDNVSRLVRTMRNKDGKITSEILDALRKITTMHDFDMNSLIPCMLVLKDNFGEIDFNKMAYFISLYSLDNATINSVAKNLVKEYNMSDEMFINILTDIYSFRYYDQMFGYANLLSGCNVTEMEPKTRNTALGLINKILNVINYENANEQGKETHKILKDLAGELG